MQQHAPLRARARRQQGEGDPVLGRAQLAVPLVAASSAGSLFLPPAKSRRQEKHVKTDRHEMPRVPLGAPFARGGGGLTG